jgi:hypothetical protein
MVDGIAQHVEVGVAAVDRGDLNAGNEAYPVLPSGLERFFDAVDGVVVGKRQQLHSGGRRGVDHPTRR